MTYFRRTTVKKTDTGPIFGCGSGTWHILSLYRLPYLTVPTVPSATVCGRDAPSTTRCGTVGALGTADTDELLTKLVTVTTGGVLMHQQPTADEVMLQLDPRKSTGKK